MQDESGEAPSTELGERLARLERLVAEQRAEMAELRTELRQARPGGRAADDVPVSDYVARSRKVELPREPVVAKAEPVVIAPVAAGGVVAAEASAGGVNSFGSAPSFSDGKAEVHRSLENRIGSQLFNRVGIVALLIGVAWFLKLAYDNQWIHPTPMGKVISGLLVGAGIVLWSERFRRKGYDAFSYSLKAVGTGTLYMALWASFQIYHLLPASVALIAMVGVTAWNAIMAWAQDSELLAVYALVGGFATPALLGSGGNHEVFLFSYILAMDAAVLLLLAKKPWQRLLIGSFPGTMIYFIGWYAKFFTADQAGVTALFVVLLAAPFVAVALVGKQREDVGEGMFAPLGAASFLALALYSVLQDSGRHAWLPWGAVALAAVYLLLMRVRRNGLAEAMHLALAVIFLTIAIPLKAEGRWITVGWLAEGVALIWVAAKLLGPEVQARVRGLMRWFGCIALALGVVESLIFWIDETAAHAFWNGRFGTEIFAVAALGVAAWLARHPREDDGASRLNWPVIAVGSMLAAHVVAALAGSREIAAFWGNDAASALSYRTELAAISVAAFLMVYGAGLAMWLARPACAEDSGGLLRWLAALYLGVGFVAMIVAPVVNDGPVRAVWNARLLFEVMGAASLAVTAWLAWRAQGEGRLFAAVCFVGLNLLLVLAGVHEISTYFGVSASGDAGLAEAATISAWLMIYAAALLVAGFWKRMAFVRWQGLGLLVFTIGKVFLYDMRNLSSGYRVLSFIGLGVLLMTVSFAYQRDWLKLRDDDGGVR